ncbi:MAG TPA: sigma-70 family RNA polymerase sigma factor [Acetobacteraceae bacterium]|jgi:RNA polymerase sigma-70 factor (ECF subfamily)|nr:sigma-70 family RNA polymerase sigma factor [Acetobacteraceae bacterium]
MDDARDSAAFARVILPHLDAAYNLARWLLRDGDVAQDVVHDAMLRAMTYFAGYRGGDARAWLMQIVRTTAYDRMAKRRDSREVPIEPEPVHEPVDPADDPEDALVRVQAHDTLAKALDALPVELRECVVLRELEEMSYRDIARVTGVPIGTVMSRLWRARRELLRWGQARCAG